MKELEIELEIELGSSRDLHSLESPAKRTSVGNVECDAELDIFTCFYSPPKPLKSKEIKQFYLMYFLLFEASL